MSSQPSAGKTLPQVLIINRLGERGVIIHPMQCFFKNLCSSLEERERGGFEGSAKSTIGSVISLRCSRLLICLVFIIKLRVGLLNLNTYTLNKKYFYIVHLASMLYFLCCIFEQMLNIIKFLHHRICELDFD